ncbi:S8 family peptidase [Cylindrospermum sp. FACHB-282]|uniref:S8 family peptidase n=1 Tax=Cylindrospermum sp. FACHB-282 TaxID=2692794 RepID=UPI0016847F7D|nr:S8 family serine peptidase [Cylindrospermum sp. FACHB-282]MBD2385984.1 S8 family serine peptidase [Cylindrospermum sp. FACHB-282]
MINSGSPVIPPTQPSTEPTTTGKFIVLFDNNRSHVLNNLFSENRIAVSSTAENNHELSNLFLEPSNALILHNLNVAVVNASAADLSNLSTADVVGGNPILTFEAERFVSIQTTTASTEVTRVDESQVTWGLDRTKIPACPFSGRGIRVAILDTGLDMNHPDFANRQIVSQSFIEGESAQDVYGHGTHCTGTSCGSSRPTQLPRYGIAYETAIYVGKVLNNEQGKGTDGSILAGINWAVDNNCQIISMSLGARVAVGQAFSQIYQTIAKRLLERGTLIIAAAGNDSWRNLIENPIVNPVSHPANCPSIMAVGAVDSELQIAWFSNRGIDRSTGGEVDIVAPGVKVYSSWPLEKKYNILDGTSMATPHVAGIAALLAQAHPDARGKALWDLLTSTAKSLPPLDVADVGVGLVQAPNTANSGAILP